ncbi:MAG: FecR family protein [Planctomycetota bacterium]|nr:FecR family protein [Planctomycetota bacterium]
MPPLPRDIQLIGYYLDGLPSAQELAELESRLRADQGVAGMFVAISRMDACLETHFHEEKGVRNIAAVIQNIEAGQPAPAPPQALTPSRWRAARPWAAVAAVLVLLFGVAAGLYLWKSADTENLLLEGSVLVGGVEVQRIPEGARFVVPDAAPAVIRLTDGSRATFEPSSEAVLRGRSAEQRQTVELVDGGGSFQVAKSGGSFEVATHLGSVTVPGTEFSVRLLPAGEREKESARAGVRPGAMAVAVKSGVVNVHFAGRTYVLREGQSRRFAPEGERKARQAVFSGRVIAVGPDTITVLRKKSDERTEESNAFALDARETKILIETEQMEAVRGEDGKTMQRPKVAEGAMADLKLGQQVDVTYIVEGNKAVKVLVRKPAPPRRNKENEGTPPSERPKRAPETDSRPPPVEK